MKKIILYILLVFPCYCFSQNKVDIVTLTTTAEGRTKDEAVQNALRSAIEQSMGAFISSKTEILNDELISDKIVSVSSGNIKKYEVISSQQLINQNTLVAVKAEVSMSKLASFCKNNGVSVDFDGELFGANVKLKELYKKNEIEALKHLKEPFKHFANNAYNYKISAKDPVAIGTTQYINLGEGVTQRIKYDDRSKKGQWEVPLTISASANQNFFSALDLLYNTVSSLSISKGDLENYSKSNTASFCITLAISNKNKGTFYLRSEEAVKTIISMIEDLRMGLTSFQINSGNRMVNYTSVSAGYRDRFKLATRNVYCGIYGREGKYQNFINSILDNVEFPHGITRAYDSCSSYYKNFNFNHKGLTISFLHINKDKYDLFNNWDLPNLNVLDKGLTTDEISKIKKYTISPN